MRTIGISLFALLAASCGGAPPRDSRPTPTTPPAARAAVDTSLLVQQFQADEAALDRAYNLPFAVRRSPRMKAFYDGWLDEDARVPFYRPSSRV